MANTNDHKTYHNVELHPELRAEIYEIKQTLKEILKTLKYTKIISKNELINKIKDLGIVYFTRLDGMCSWCTKLEEKYKELDIQPDCIKIVDVTTKEGWELLCKYINDGLIPVIYDTAVPLTYSEITKKYVVGCKDIEQIIEELTANDTKLTKDENSTLSS